MTRFAGRAGAVSFALVVALVGLVPQAGAQSREELENLIAASLPDGRPVRFEYTVKTNLAGDRYVSLDTEGTFEGRTRLAFDFRSNQWPADRKASFLATETRVAFKETPPPRDQPDEWKLYQANDEKEREPAYASLLLPQQFVRDAASYAGSFEAAGSCGVGEVICQAHEGILAVDRIVTLFALYGLVTEPQDEVIEQTGMVTLWVGKEDGLLRGAELVLSATVKKAPDTKDPAGNGGGAPAGGGGRNWDETTPDLMTSKGMLEGQETGGGGGMQKGEKAKEVEKHFSIKLVLDQVVEEGRKLPDKIEPDPAAAELAGW